jgi:hypothetical protein
MHKRYLLLLITLSGCGLPDVRWHPVTTTGPYISETRQSQLMQRCDAPRIMVDARRCDFAFTTKEGVLEVEKTVVPVLDDYVKNLPEFQSWPTGYGQMKVPPYKFFLLTLEPMILVAIPANNHRQSSCASILTCIYSRVITIGYSYGPVVEIGDGSLWFSPGTTKGLLPLPSEGNEFKFPVPQIDASLVRDGKQWKFFRQK